MTIVGCVAGAAGCGGSTAKSKATPAPAPALTTVVNSQYLAQVQQTALVDGQGHPLYIFGPDHAHSVTCHGLCADDWPPAFTAAHHSPRTTGGTQPRLLSSDSDGGQRVLTYGGWPLYTYVDDVQPGSVAGSGVDANGGYWYLMQPDGMPVVPPGAPAPTPTPQP